MRISWQDMALSVLIHLTDEGLSDLQLSVTDRLAHEKHWNNPREEAMYAELLQRILKERAARRAGM